MSSLLPRTLLILCVAVAVLYSTSPAQPVDVLPNRVLTMTNDTGIGRPLPENRGSIGLWQRLLKLQTTASVMHTTAHPDDEHAGTLTLLSRGQGVRTALLTLNRGEGGANATGSELFDELGLVRTEELRRAGRYYGLDDQYYTSTIDYGFSKTREEALTTWDREAVLADMVRVIRLNRPLVVISRFHGSERDGHGHHQSAGYLTPEAVEAAADPTRFSEQISAEGLRPWRVRKLYRGGVRSSEVWQVSLDVDAYSPWLGDTYRHFGRYGTSLQRSQTSGRVWSFSGDPYYYERLTPTAPTDEKETGLFSGLDTRLSALFNLTGESPPAGAVSQLQTIENHIQQAVERFAVDRPARVVSSLTAALSEIRTLLETLNDQPEAAFILHIKARQCMDAIQVALGTTLTAVAVPDDGVSGGSPFRAPPTMDVAVPAQPFQVQVSFDNPSPVSLESVSVSLAGPTSWTIEPISAAPSETTEQLFRVQIPEGTDDFSAPYFGRTDIRESHYTIHEPAYRHLPNRPPILQAMVRYRVEGTEVEMKVPVRTHSAQLPYGYVLRELKVAPALSVTIDPAMRILTPAHQDRPIPVEVTVRNNATGHQTGRLSLELPEGWTAEPGEHDLSFAEAGREQRFTFEVTASNLQAEAYPIQAVAEAGGRRFRTGYTIIEQRDLDTQYLYRPALTRIRGIDVTIAPDLNVGYVMGVGDEVPEGVEQLGASVQLLSADDLASADLSVFDVIVVGTRAYAVRTDLITHNQRLMDFAEAGGHLIVLYQTPEFDPNRMAPIPASLPRNAEEVSEENAPVTILAPDHPVFHTPNRITPADFENWVEQRGSKFFAEWDPAYTAMIETHDTGQAPQEGSWLIARYGEGYYTYFALAIHRQVPYGVPGPYRIIANLLSLGK